MIINLSPVSPLSRDATLQVVKKGDALIINGMLLDFSRLPSGATLPATAFLCEAVNGPVHRVGEDIQLELVLPCWADSIEEALFPADILNPADGPIQLPGMELGESQPVVEGVIDWSQVITAEDKAQAAADQLLATVIAQVAQLRSVADEAIAPLQDAVDLREATDTETALLTEWKRYRVELNRLADQEGYPSTIDWPAPPA